MNDPLAAMDATWPAASVRRVGPWVLREGRGGGHRVSATTWEDGPLAAGGPGEAALAMAEAAAVELGQPPLFRLTPDEAALDAALAARGYRRIEPVVLYAAPVARIAAEPLPPVSAFAHWPPLQILRDLWEETGIGPARQAIMDRAPGPRAAVLGRSRDRAAGGAFVALHEGIAMVHAVAVLPDLRRLGTARHMMIEAAHWAQEAGAVRIGLAVGAQNRSARAFYEALGMQPAGAYHYRAA